MANVETTEKPDFLFSNIRYLMHYCAIEIGIEMNVIHNE